jgi:hypothetical protein
METPESSDWPILSILRYGTFGTKSPAGRRYHTRTGIALMALLVVWPVSVGLWVTDRSPILLWRVTAGFTPGLIYGYIAWEMRRYWLALDELARRLQMEAAAYTYLAGIAAGTVLGGLSLVFFGHGWVWLWCNPLWIVMLEPARGVILYFLARRY